jgi:hypothetical protein
VQWGFRVGVVMGERRSGNVVILPAALPDVGEWAPCYCCGRSYLAANMVRFYRHPDDAVCVDCAAWLHDRSRPIIRQLYPIWRLPAFVRARLTADLPAAAHAAGGKKAGSGPQLSPPQAGLGPACQAGRLSTGR